MSLNVYLKKKSLHFKWVDLCYSILKKAVDVDKEIVDVENRYLHSKACETSPSKDVYPVTPVYLLGNRMDAYRMSH